MIFASSKVNAKKQYGAGEGGGELLFKGRGAF